MRAHLLVIGLSILFVGCVNAPSDDIANATYAVCCGSGCCCPSLNPGGGRINTGDTNPDNPCEVCDPSTSTTAWTPVPDCDAGMGGGDTDAGPAPTDGGPMETDAGPGDTDAGGVVETDAGPGGGTDAGGATGGTDAGPADAGGDDGGCSVSATGSGGAPAILIALGALVALPMRRRRR